MVHPDAVVAATHKLMKQSDRTGRRLRNEGQLFRGRVVLLSLQSDLPRETQWGSANGLSTSVNTVLNKHACLLMMSIRTLHHPLVHQLACSEECC